MTNNHITDGATALKLENEVINKTQNTNELLNTIDNQSDVSQEIVSENTAEEIVDNHTENFNKKSDENPADNQKSNGLENFGIDEIEESTPDLFNLKQLTKNLHPLINLSKIRTKMKI